MFAQIENVNEGCGQIEELQGMPKRRCRQIKQLGWGQGEISGNRTAEKSSELMEDISSDRKKYIKQ